jgi:hypothetical protein
MLQILIYQLLLMMYVKEHCQQYLRDLNDLQYLQFSSFTYMHHTSQWNRRSEDIFREKK